MAQTQADSKSDPVVLAAELRPLLARNAAQVERDRRHLCGEYRGSGAGQPVQTDDAASLGWLRRPAGDFIERLG